MAKRKPSRIGKIPMFIKKLCQILDDLKHSGVISWLNDGNGFQIHNVATFTEKVLPCHFKHNNMASFVRQLHMYGFSRPSDSHQHIYTHMRFERGNANNMKFIRRKSTNSKDNPGEECFQEQSEEESDSDHGDDREALHNENEELKRQNEELRNKLNQYEEMKNQLKSLVLQMNRCLDNNLEDNENEKSEKQANSSDSTQSNNTDNVCKSDFSIFKKNGHPNHSKSYEVLLKGSEAIDGKKDAI